MNIMSRISVSSSSQCIMRAAKAGYNEALSQLSKLEVAGFFRGRKVAFYSTSNKPLEAKPQLTGQPKGIDIFNFEESIAKIKSQEKQYEFASKNKIKFSDAVLQDAITHYNVTKNKTPSASRMEEVRNMLLRHKEVVEESIRKSYQSKQEIETALKKIDNDIKNAGIQY